MNRVGSHVLNRSILGMLTAACTLLAMPAAAHDPSTMKTCRLTVSLIDAETKQPISGVVRIRNDRGAILRPVELTARGTGVSKSFAIHDWFVLTKPTVIRVPEGQFTLEGFQGLETELASSTVEVRDQGSAEVRLSVKRFINARARRLQSGNTHIHLQKIGRRESEQYLLAVAAAEQLDLLYISYLERAEADLQYTTNKFTREDLARLTRTSHHDHAHRHEFDNGEEHRHNFAGFGEGYGHVMFLHLPELVRPVSIGPGIMKQGFDAPALQPGIVNAVDQDAAVIWCHNRYGLEDVPNWLAGNLHANNIFDGGTRGSYRHSFYRYLNAGVNAPFSTGTDWFIYDFNRVYIYGDADEVNSKSRLNSVQWLTKLKQGRSFITNGPLLDLRVIGEGQDIGVGPGAQLKAEHGDTIKIHATGIGRVDFDQLQLIRNGQVVAQTEAAASKSGGHYAASLSTELKLDGPCWLALRTPPPSTPREPDLQRKTKLNEYGRELFSHTSAVHVLVDNQRFVDPAAVQVLHRDVTSSIEAIRKQGKFPSDAAKEKVLDVYRSALQSLNRKLRDRQPKD